MSTRERVSQLERPGVVAVTLRCSAFNQVHRLNHLQHHGERAGGSRRSVKNLLTAQGSYVRNQSRSRADYSNQRACRSGEGL